MIIKEERFFEEFELQTASFDGAFDCEYFECVYIETDIATDPVEIRDYVRKKHGEIDDKREDAKSFFYVLKKT